jgi:glycine/D-amino acid oxidase-like deaminating enzyme
LTSSSFGGGYSGLWTAYHLLERDPALGIAIIERDICGGGASGRNGGFATGWWGELPRIVELFGPDEGVRLCHALGESIRAIGAFCDRHGVDAWYTPGGCMATAAAQAQWGALDGELLLAKQLGVEEELRYLSAALPGGSCRVGV